MDGGLEQIEYKHIRLIDEELSAIGLGTYGISNYDKAEKAFLYAIEKGINLIDTAEIYNTEDFVGRLIRKVGREKLFITTKIWPNHLHSRDSVLNSARTSLKKMGIASADLILIHWPNNRMSIEDQVRNFETVILEGLTKYIGVSNFSVEQMEIARQSVKKAEIVCNQVEYNLSNRSPEKEIIPYCRNNGMAVVAYTPIEKGRPSISNELSLSLGKTPVQIALRYLASQENVIPIPKAENIEHVKEIIGSMGWKLEPQQIEKIRDS
ncbi:MAG: aldo/keto reductase [Thermoplasmatales archaeon]